MGERKGVNKYYPPDWTPKMGNLNKYHGTHALRERARKIHEGIIIVSIATCDGKCDKEIKHHIELAMDTLQRLGIALTDRNLSLRVRQFEMPYNIWCNGCGNHIGMGVRYNAQKRKIGNYYTTPIHKFRMKCHLCDQYFEIQTDPKATGLEICKNDVSNCDYVILSGAKRKEERWDPSVTENVQTTDRDVKAKLVQDAMFKLEHEVLDKQKAVKVAPTLTRLEEIRDPWKDDYAVNQILREKFRGEKKDINSEMVKAEELKIKGSLPSDLELVPESKDDIKLAKRIRYGKDKTRPDIARRHLRQGIKQSSIFGNPADTKTSLATKLCNVTHQKQRKIGSLSTPELMDIGSLVRKSRGKKECGKNNDMTSDQIDEAKEATTEQGTASVSDARTTLVNKEATTLSAPPSNNGIPCLSLGTDTITNSINTDNSGLDNRKDDRLSETDLIAMDTVNSDGEPIETEAGQSSLNAPPSVLNLLSAYTDSDSSD